MVTCYRALCEEFSIAKWATISNGDIFYTGYSPLWNLLLLVYILGEQWEPAKWTYEKLYIKKVNN